MNIDSGPSALLAPQVVGLAPPATETPGAAFSVLLAVAAPMTPGAAALPPTPLATVAPGLGAEPALRGTVANVPLASPRRGAVQAAAPIVPSAPDERRVTRDQPVTPAVEAPSVALANGVARPMTEGASAVAAVPVRRAAKAEASDENPPAVVADAGAVLPAAILPDAVLPRIVVPFAAPDEAEFATIMPLKRGTMIVPPPSGGANSPGPSVIGRDAILTQAVNSVGVRVLRARPQSEAAAPIAVSLPLPGDMSPGLVSMIEASPAVPARPETVSDGLADALDTPVSVVISPAPAVPAKPMIAQATPVVATLAAAAGAVTVDRRGRMLPNDATDAPLPLPTTLADIAPRLLSAKDTAASQTPSPISPREGAAPAAATTDLTTGMAVATDRFGDVRIAVEGTATDVKVSLALTPAATFAAADAQRLATGLAADLAATGVRLQSLDISGGDTARGGPPQGRSEHPPPRAPSAPFAPQRSPTPSRSDRYA